METSRALLFLSLVLFFQCSPEQTELKEAEWLIGTWRDSENSKPVIYENWKRINNDEFAGSNFVIRGNDTAFVESIRLVNSSEGVRYIPRKKDENHLPVEFTTKEFSENRVVFENPRYDFPKTISYTKVTTDSLRVEIAGTKNGSGQNVFYSMVRVK